MAVTREELLKKISEKLGQSAAGGQQSGGRQKAQSTEASDDERARYKALAEKEYQRVQATKKRSGTYKAGERMREQIAKRDALVAADNEAKAFRKTAALAQKEYDDYVNSQEFQKKKQNAATQLTRNTPMSEVPRNAPQMTEVFEDDTSKELKARADYAKKLANDEKTSRVMAQDMAEINAMPEEDRKLFEQYAESQNTRRDVFVNTNPILWFREYNKETDAEKPLLEKYGEERLERWKETYNRYNSQQMVEKTAQDVHDNNDTLGGAVAQNIAGLPARALGGVEALAGRMYELGEKTGRYPTLAPYTPQDALSVYGNTVTADTAERIAGDGDSKLRSALAVGYQAATSAADSATRLLVGGGATGALALAATNSFTNALSEASQKGATPEQAYLMATANAGLEVLTEKVSLDSLLNKAKAAGGSNLRKFLLNTLGQAGVEASEEEADYIGGLIAEAAILKENSEYNQTIAELVANGMSYEEAKAQADKNVWNEAVNTAIISAGSGAMMGAGATAYSNVMAKLGNRQGTQANPQKAAESPQTAVSPETSTDTTNAQTPDTEAAATPQTANELTNALDKLKETGNVSNKTVEKILSDPEAVGQLQERTGLDLAQMATASEKRNAVKTAVRLMAEGAGVQATSEINTALDELSRTGSITDEAANEILFDLDSMRQLQARAGLDTSNRDDAPENFLNAIKEAVRQLAGDTATSARNGTEGTWIDDAGRELAEKAPARQETPEATPERQAVQNAFDRVLGVDTGTEGNYNQINENPTQGGTENGTGLQNADGTGLPGGTGTERVSRADAGALPVSGQAPGGMEAGTQVVPGSIQRESGGGNSQNDLRVSGELRVSDQLQEAQRQRGTPTYAVKDTTADPVSYEQALNAGRNSDTNNGWCVTPKSAQELKDGNVRTFMNDNGTVGVGIAPDGDIVAVFKNKNGGPPKALDTMMPIAIEQGGDRLDCYGEGLAKLYSKYGFEPVARVEFNSEYANEGWSPDKGEPFIYVMKHNGDSADTVARKMGTYPKITDEQLAALPTYGKNDYDAAMAYRDSLMGKGSPQVADSPGQSTGGGQGDATAKSSVGAADRNFTGTAAYDDLLSDDNVQPRRASDAKNVEVPKVDAYGRDVSESAHNLMNSDIISDRDIDTAKRLIQEGSFGHETQKMADVRDRVYDEIQEKGVSASVREVSKAAAGGKISEYDIAKAQVLFAMLTDKKGARAENMAGELLVDLGEMATQSGRQLNMFKLLRKLTPEGQISAVKSNINRYVDTLNEHRSANKQVNVETPAELEQAYVKAARSGNEATQKQALDQMYEYAAAQIPATLEEKFNSLRHLSMLGAPLTHIRNFGATGAFRPISDIKRTISAGIQAVALDQKNRTAAVIGLGKESRELLSWAKNDAKSDMAVSMMKGTYQNGDNARSEIENRRTIFKNKALEGARKFNFNALEAEDMAWKKREYALTLASFLKARGYTVDQVTGGAVPSPVMAEGRELAVKEALKSTFNDRNKFSDTISKFRKKGSDPWSRSLDIMAQGILPYTRTPANLGVRSFEYSFAGLAKSAYDLTEGVKSGKITAAQGIDNLASGLTGTGMMFLGGALAAGIIPGVRLVGAKPDDDEDEENTQEYALEIGDLSIGISWLAPVNIPLFIGANLYNKIKASGDDGDVDPWDVMTAIVDSTTSILDPVLELSCMSGLNDAIDNMKYEDTAGDKFIAMAYSAATGYFLQAIPTLLGRIEKGVEPNKKRTFSNGETTVQRSVERTLGGAFQKLPGDPFQIDKVDAYGNVVKDSGNLVTRLANALLNPFNVQKIDRSELTQEIKRLSGVQPDKVNMPSAPKTVSYTDTDGNHHDNERLTAEQYSTLEKTQKQTAAKLLGQVIGTDIYKAMTDDQKADVFSYVYTYAREKGRAEAIDGYPGLSDSWMQDVDKNGYGAIVEKVVTKSFSNAFDTMEADELDQAYGLYKSLPSAEQESFRKETGGRVGYYVAAKDAGVSDGAFTDLYGTYKELEGNKTMEGKQKAQEWSRTLAEAYEDGRITKDGFDALKEKMVFRQSFPIQTEKFDDLTESGLSSDVADQIIKGLADLQGTGSVDKDTGKAAVTNSDKWGYIAALDGLSDKERDRVMLLYMPDYDPEAEKPNKTELKYAYLRSKGYSAEQFTQTYNVTQEYRKKADMIAAWEALGYSREEAQTFYKLFKGKIV